MQITQQSVTLLDSINEDEVLLRLEMVARNAYRSESKDIASTKKLVRKIMKKNHLGILEHVLVSFKVTANRAILNEMTRHRIASFVQNSTRYIKFSEGIHVVVPHKFEVHSAEYDIFIKAMQASEKAYLDLINLGVAPQNARDVLPLSLASDIIVTMNLRSWLNYLELRTASAAHPQIREVSNKIHEILKDKLPFIFGNLS